MNPDGLIPDLKILLSASNQQLRKHSTGSIPTWKLYFYGLRGVTLAEEKNQIWDQFMKTQKIPNFCLFPFFLFFFSSCFPCFLKLLLLCVRSRSTAADQHQQQQRGISDRWQQQQQGLAAALTKKEPSRSGAGRLDGDGWTCGDSAATAAAIWVMAATACSSCWVIDLFPFFFSVG